MKQLSKEEYIMSVAEKLFAERGFEATSIRDISAAANINVSMISYYFGSKEMLYEKIFEYRMKWGTGFIKEIMAKQELNEWEKLIGIITSHIERLQILPHFYVVLQTEQLISKNPKIKEFIKKFKLSFLSVYESLLEEGCRKKIFTKKPSVDILHAIVAGTLFYAVRNIPLYSEFAKSESMEIFIPEFINELKNKLIETLKTLLGYEEK
ncbi:TetR/AcrR family transcriptional regulator [Riemerella columbipharyngis]|uniref:DNA-binding transcriptional regulator, AcrR family n=1 Tax=Riemerella columbipharyngis TaxID=1071918 RepID=A0A1G7EDG5_9FLAO|nr:TetR/AcrR family transcriptional regulator [Riemerella columbipharyngis]SDE61719.1 DNA-binding transcriptional regulator, AcrR family [Riemerella columbipharyngis]